MRLGMAAKLDNIFYFDMINCSCLKITIFCLVTYLPTRYVYNYLKVFFSGFLFIFLEKDELAANIFLVFGVYNIMPWHLSWLVL